MLNKTKEWKQKINQFKGKRDIRYLVFILEDRLLYLEEIRRHDCNAGVWNVMSVSDKSHFYGKAVKDFKYLKKCLSGYDLYPFGDMHISGYIEDGFFSAGVTAVKRLGNTLEIHIARESDE